MQRFQFRLASVLNWRMLQLELQKSKLQNLFAERRRNEQDLARLAEQQREAERMLALDAVEGYELAALDSHRDSLRRAAERLRTACAECDERIAGQRARVSEADRRVRLLERLKERRLAEWQLEADREMEALASESFLAKWVRKR